MSAEDHWTPGIGLARGLCTGAVAGFVLGALVLGGAWLIMPDSGILDSYFKARMCFAFLAVGFGHAWLVTVIGEWAGGMSSVLFCALGAVLSTALGVANVLILYPRSGMTAGLFSPLVTALIWLALPTAVGGCAAAAARMGSASV